MIQKMKLEISFLKSNYNIQPKLIVIEIGHLRDSELYIKEKKKMAKACDIQLDHLQLPPNVTESTVLECVENLNRDPSVHGIMLQLPLDSEKNIDASKALNTIVTHKDVEGLNQENTATLGRKDVLCFDCGGLKLPYIHIPCTAAACFSLIRHVNFPLAGSRCVIVGCGRLVGAPTSDLLLNSGRATIIKCHEYSQHLEEFIRQADILIAAAGHPEFIKGEWIKQGALVIDCGYNFVPDPTNASKLRYVGDVHFASAITNASWITPVPGGVGPLSLAKLFGNTLNSAKWSVNIFDSMCSCSSESHYAPEYVRGS